MNSRLKPIVLTTTICLAIGAVATLAATRIQHRERSNAPSSATETDLSDVATRGELAELRGQLAALRISGGALSAQVEAGALAPQPDEAPPANGNPPAGEPANAPDPESNFRAEPRDSAWSSAAEAKVATALRADDVKANVRSTECRARTCRVEIADADPSKNVFMHLNQHLFADFPSALIIEGVGADGHPEAVFYFQRPELAVR